MSLQRSAIVTVAALTLAASASAQVPVFQWDVNDAPFQVLNAAGAPGAFNGVTHTGSINFNRGTRTKLESVLIDEGAGFVRQPGGGTLTDFRMTINLVNGVVTGGSLAIDVNGGSGGGGDTYTATVAANSGRVETTAIGGFTIDSTTFAGVFSDATWSTVDVSRWFQQNQTILGAQLTFKFRPNSSGRGESDSDIYAIVPAPGAVALMGIAGLVAVRRRRA